MKLALLLMILLLPLSLVRASSPGNGGSTSAGLKVSVTVVEPSQIDHVAHLGTVINGEGKKQIKPGSHAAGRASIPAKPDSEILFSIQGEEHLSDGNGGSITFEPEARIGRNVLMEQMIAVNGSSTPVTITESDNGGYRGIAELELYGTIDAGVHTSGTFRTTYTITTEHF